MKGRMLWTLLLSTGLAWPSLASARTFNDTLTTLDTAPVALQRKHEQSVQRNVSANAVSIVVIDAGHGGHDGGCSGAVHGAREKVIALKIALGLGERIKAEMPGIKVIYTRETDKFVPLHERASIANRAQADLFISIHCNAMPAGARALGSETYVMGLHTAQHNLNVAKRENAAIHLEEDIDRNYAFDPDSPAGHIILSMFQHAFLEQSMVLADRLESRLGEREGHPSRGVKQAGFMVLKETAMPSVLVETGYLTNANEEAYLNSENGQAQTITALFSGLQDYLEDRVKGASSSQPVLASSPSSGGTSKASISSHDSKTQMLNKVSEPTVLSGATEPSFFVQLAASSNQVKTDNEKWTKLASPIRYVKEGQFYKYQAGPLASITEAENLLVIARQRGFPDAFLTAYRTGSRLPQAELDALRKK